MGVFACGALLAACGGLQRPEPSDASADDATQTVVVGPDGATTPVESGAASVPLAVGPGEPDPCGASQRYEYQPLEKFDNSMPPSQLAGQYSAYVSYDGSGILFEAMNCGAASSCVQGFAPGNYENDAGGSYISSTLCSNCFTGPGGRGGGPDGGGCGSCLCTSGFQPLTFGYPPTARCGTDTNAIHLHASTTDATGLSIWGMNLGVDLRQNCSGVDAGAMGTNGPCYFDARQWTGISFWALLGPGSTSTVALATVGDPQTGGVLGGIYPFNNPGCGNPACVPGVAANLINTCTSATMPLCLCDPFGQGIGLVNQWTFYAIPFVDMKQKGYGKPVPELDLAHILSFTFGLGKANWDVWVDEIAFYRPKTN